LDGQRYGIKRFKRFHISDQLGSSDISGFDSGFARQFQHITQAKNDEKPTLS
jgi:hypothetical protein